MKKIWVLARMTFQEALRRKIIITGLVLGVCFLLIFSIGFHLVITNAYASAARSSQTLGRMIQGEGTNVLIQAGLYTVTFLAIAMGALLGADTLAGDISSGIIQTVVTKPIRRSDVVLGKWLGFAGLLLLYTILMAGGVLLSVWLQTAYTPPRFMLGFGLIYLEALLIMTLALACSSLLPGLATGGVVFGMWGLAFIGGWIEQFGSLMQYPAAVKVGIVTSLIIPSEALWRRASYEMQSPLSAALGMSPFATISVPSTLMVVYAAVYVMLALAAAIRIFSRRDL